MGMLILDEEVVYDGENHERKGQTATVVLLGGDALIEIEFETQDSLGSKRLTTTRDSVARTTVRQSMEVPSYRPPMMDDGRVTEVDPRH